LSQDKNVEFFLTAKEDDLIATQEKLGKEKMMSNFTGGFTLDSMLHKVTKVSHVLSNEIGSMVSVANFQAPSSIEVDTWFTKENEYLTTLNDGLSEIKSQSVEQLVIKQEKVESTIQFADQLVQLSESEKPGDKVSKYLMFFQDMLRQKALLDENLIKNQTAMFEDPVGDQQRLSGGGKRIMENRLDLLLNYHIARNATIKIQNAPSTEQQVLEKQEAEEKEAAEKKKLDDISEKVRNQVEDYKTEKSKLMRWALRELVRENIEHGEQVISLWKELGSKIAQS